MYKIVNVKRIPPRNEHSFRITMLYEVELHGVIIIRIIATKGRSSPVVKTYAENEKCFTVTEEAQSEIRKLILARIDDDIRATRKIYD